MRKTFDPIKCLNIVLAISLAVFILTLSIAVPILVRPFYYMQIDQLAIPAVSGVSKEDCKKAYDEMLDYCIGLSDRFSTGNLKWSTEGKSHFDDCRELFALDFNLLLYSGTFIVLMIVLHIIDKFKMEAIGKHLPGFWAGSILLGAVIVIAFFAASNFELAFTIFHVLFFPGKENWLFDPKTDEIINILPEQFFANCGILIGVLILVLSMALIVFSLKKEKEIYYDK